MFDWLINKVNEREIKHALDKAKVIDRPSKIKKLVSSWRWYSQGTPGTLDYVWGFGFVWDEREHFYTHSYMGWANHSEKHRRDNCNDPAYCPWHGSL